MNWGLIRHGSTDWNMLGRLQGQNDIQLNEEGRRQARLLGRHLRTEGWEVLVSSDLKRAHETALIVAEELGIREVIVDTRLRERTHGRLDGTTLEERIALFGEHWKSLDHGVESDERLFARSAACLTELAEQYGKTKLLLVSHGATLGVLLEGLLEQMPSGLLGNTAFSRLSKDDTGQWICPLYNCTAHLAENAGRSSGL
ncbi:histidine phosphatase family protein [Paenibacillus koleovorans]|uniref:histidine phosphatase family protein n=1 Tax=Paenibacillus koleovorans TaxID=121608 RepID=UPI000FD7DA25|nr:histidine phosphatase family protein [Paenibacillus koleovorans]